MIFRDVISLLARVFVFLIDTATQEVPMKNIWKKLSVQFLRYAIELLHVKNVTHVTHDVKWRPIVTTFGTLIENIRIWVLLPYFFDDFTSNISCSIGVLHVNTPFTLGLRPRCDRILGFGRNDRDHSPSVLKSVSVRSPLSQKWSRTLSLTRHWSGRFCECFWLSKTVAEFVRPLASEWTRNTV